ncbi:hypothetical protein ABPG74_008014 [Tetrahymena malaccensis]
MKFIINFQNSCNDIQDQGASDLGSGISQLVNIEHLVISLKRLVKKSFIVFYDNSDEENGNNNDSDQEEDDEEEEEQIEEIDYDDIFHQENGFEVNDQQDKNNQNLTNNNE